MSGSAPLTQLLLDWRQGDQAAAALFSQQVYAELQVMARARVAAEPAGITLQPTALVNEAYLRLLQGAGELRDRVHFFATAALHMRAILVDHARARRAEKRGGDLLRVTLDERVVDGLASGDPAEPDLLQLEDALAALEAEDPRSAKVVELTYYGGLSRDEIALALECSVPTVDRALRFGRVWLKRALSA
jgi:RNA polymerase sigma factor (TIGR02999 family)